MGRQGQPIGPVLATATVLTIAVGGIVLPWLIPDRSTAKQDAGSAQPAALVTTAPAVTTTVDPMLPAETVTPGVTIAAPASATWGIPVGFPQSAAGVRAAAVTWVATFGDLLGMGPLARDDTLSDLLSQRALDETVEKFREDRERFSGQFGRDLSQAVWEEAPVSTAIVSAEPTRAVVEVWAVLLFGTGTDGIEMLWRTHEITLVWEAGSWRVDDVVRRQGPTPVLAVGEMPSPATEFDEVTDWVPAVLAGTSLG